jgi:hypothetical protein
MIELGASAAALELPVAVDAVVCVAVPPAGVVVVVVVRDESLPEMRPRSVSAMRVASAFRRNTT